MKKTIFALAAIATISFAACSKSKDDEAPKNKLLGKWTPVSTKQKITDTRTNDFTENDLTVYAGDYIEFRDNGKVYFRETNPNEGPGYDPHDTMSYSIKDNILMLEDDEMTITEVTGNALVLTLEESTEAMRWLTTYSYKK